MPVELVYFILGALAIAGGVVFLVFPKRISAFALRKRYDPYKKAFMMSPAVMVIGGVLLLVVGGLIIAQGIFPNA